jgi:hypothetical protein
LEEPEKTLTWVDDPETTLFDVRDGNSIKETGKIKAIVHAERGLLEFFVDQEHSMGKAEYKPRHARGSLMHRWRSGCPGWKNPTRHGI